MQQVGLGVSFVRDSHLPGTMAPFAEGKFMATFTSVTDEEITSVATGTVFQTIAGYTLQCGNVEGDAVFGDAEILIPGKLVLEHVLRK